MAIQPIQMNIESKSHPSKKDVRPYLQANEVVRTDNLTKPLPPKGHLIHDNPVNGVKYFFKDIAYDMQSVKSGFKGEVNDHKAGRLNDVGLKLGGLMIAAYLASKTKDPKVRAMEYVGLITFLTSMSVFPKLAINLPARLKHGFAIDKQYIDDQDRKKSVWQDTKYVPTDMYKGEIPSEDLDKIADNLGIPKDAKNRDQLAIEQMTKIATQNNTLWMLAAGTATPTITALACCGIEHLISQHLEKAANEKGNAEIEKIIEVTKNMTKDAADNELSKNIESILSQYKGKEFPKSEIDKIVKLLSDNMDNNLAEGVKADVEKLLSGSEQLVVNEESINSMLKSARSKMKGRNIDKVFKLIAPTKEELTSAANGSKHDFRNALQKIIEAKIEKSNGVPKDFLRTQMGHILDGIVEGAATQKSTVLTEQASNSLIDLGKILGEFNANKKILDNCKFIKVEDSAETVLARYYSKFERTLLKELGIPFKNLKAMGNSEEYTQKILEEKFAELAKDSSKYQKAMKNLGAVVEEMETALNGSGEKNYLLDLVNAIENNYNNTAKRLAKADKNRFGSIIDKLVKEDVNTLKNQITSKEELYNFLDGLIPNTQKRFHDIGNNAQYITENLKGVGSSKKLDIYRMVDRYQGVRNAFNRVFMTLELYKRSLDPKYEKIIRESMMSGTVSEFAQKFHISSPDFYKKVMTELANTAHCEKNMTKHEGVVSEEIIKAFGEESTLLDRFKKHIAHFKDIVGNWTGDKTKIKHIINIEENPAESFITNNYHPDVTTPKSFFNIIGQSPVDMVKGAAKRRYSQQKWLRIMYGIAGTTVGATLLAQFFFGKINNPHNIQKQVKHETSK